MIDRCQNKTKMFLINNFIIINDLYMFNNKKEYLSHQYLIDLLYIENINSLYFTNLIH